MATFKSDHYPNIYRGHLQIWPLSKLLLRPPSNLAIIQNTYHGHLQNHLTIIKNLPWPPSKLSDHHPKYLLQPPSDLTIIQTTTTATFKISWPSSEHRQWHGHPQNHLTIIKDLSWIPSPLPDCCWYAYHSQLQSCRAMCCGNHARNQGEILLLTPKAKGDVKISCSAQTHTPTIEKKKKWWTITIMKHHVCNSRHHCNQNTQKEKHGVTTKINSDHKPLLVTNKMCHGH